MNNLQKKTSKPMLAETQPQIATLALTNLSLTLTDKTILQHVSLSLAASGITCLIGPSGAGKSSLLRCLNLLQKAWSGQIEIQQQDIRQWPAGEDALRRFIVLIAQKPAVFPVSIAENVIFGLSRKQRKTNQDVRIKTCLQQAALWDEVKYRLDEPAKNLSVGQQQRLCLARALALQPKILLLDEPTASLDPRSKQLIEASLKTLALTMPVLCVTHDLEQAQRLSEKIIFMCDGKVIETADSVTFFQQPLKLESREFLRWSSCDCD